MLSAGGTATRAMRNSPALSVSFNRLPPPRPLTRSHFSRCGKRDSLLCFYGECQSTICTTCDWGVEAGGIAGVNPCVRCTNLGECGSRPAPPQLSPHQIHKLQTSMQQFDGAVSSLVANHAHTLNEFFEIAQSSHTMQGFSGDFALTAGEAVKKRKRLSSVRSSMEDATVGFQPVESPRSRSLRFAQYCGILSSGV